MKSLAGWVCRGIGLAAAVFFIWSGWLCCLEAGVLEKNITVLLTDRSMTVSEIQNIMNQENMREIGTIHSLTAWTEEKRVLMNDRTSGRMTAGNILMIHGSSELLLPYGGILHPEDTQGCLIGQKAAEELFGTRNAAGLTVCCNNEEFVVRSVLALPEELLVVQAAAFEEVQLDHITLRRNAGIQIQQDTERFLSRYGLSGRLMRWDYYQNLSWLEELIPGKWSDLDGWQEKIIDKKQDFELLSIVEKSTIEFEYSKMVKQGRQRMLVGGLLALAVICWIIRIKNRHRSKINQI